MRIVAEEGKPFKALPVVRSLRQTGVLLAWIGVWAVGLPAAVLAQTVYIGTGEQGEPSFSDEPPATGEPTAMVILEPAAPTVVSPASHGPPSDGPLASTPSGSGQSASQINQMLTVAAALEASRIQREAQRAEARRATQSAAAPVSAPTAVGGNVPWWLLQQRRRSGLGGFRQEGTVYHDPRLRPQPPFRQGVGEPLFQEPRFGDPRFQDPRFQDPRFRDPRFRDRSDARGRGARDQPPRAPAPTWSSPLIVD